MTVSLKQIGLTLVVFIAAVLVWPVLLVVAALIAMVLGVFVADRWRKWRAVRGFRATWGAQRKDVLIVYSNSPHWQRYIEEKWLPRWGHRAVVLNWSERNQWTASGRTEVALFRAFAGEREFNPLGVVVPHHGKVQVVRFWRAFSRT